MVKRLYFFLLFLIVCFFPGCSFLAQKEQNSTRDFFAMDTYVKMILYGPEAEKAADALQVEMLRLDRQLSLYSEKSDVSLLHQQLASPALPQVPPLQQADDPHKEHLMQSHAIQLSEDTAELLTRSLKLYSETNGAFDITLSPVSKLWGFPHGPYRVPDKTEIRTVLVHTGMNAIRWDSRTRRFSTDNPAITLDFGGIAKGYAAEKMAEILKKHNIRHALLNLGGNVKAIGTKPDHSPWRVAIQHPDAKTDYLGILSVSNLSVVTSGDYERYFEKDKIRYHHILNPRTGTPARSDLRSVTVVCEDCTLADGLSTALFVLGPEAAISFWQKDKKRFQFILFTDDNTLYVTKKLLPVFETKLPVTAVR